MSRVLILCNDYVKRQMSGPAIRYFELSKVLTTAGHKVTLASLGQPDIEDAPFDIVEMDEPTLRRLAPEQDVIVVFGWTTNWYPFLWSSGARIVADLYCPFYLELLVDRERDPHPELLSPPLKSLEVTVDPVRRADFFICASEKQRDYWLGMLTAVNRINPETYMQSRDLRKLIDTVPFGMPEEPPVKKAPAMRGVIPGIGADDFIVLWGAIYNWFDPLTLIRAVGKAAETAPDIRMVVMGTRHPNPDIVTETWMLGEARKLAAELGLTGKHVFFNEGWVPYEDRADWLLEADVGASHHFMHIETHFSFRVRFLDYMWAGLPIVCTAGDVLADAVERDNLGKTVPAGDVEALTAALLALHDRRTRAQIEANITEYRRRLTWTRAAEALVRYCDDPWQAADLAASGGSPPPVPIQTPISEKGWQYYAVKGTETLVYGGPGEFARKLRDLRRRRAAGTP